MPDKKQLQELTVMEAVDHLSTLAELDIKSPHAVEEGKINWLDPKDGEEKREAVKQTFRVINNYLHHLNEKDKERLKDPDTQRGVQSIMVLVGEAAQKLDKCTALFKGVGAKNSVTYVKEYQDLQQYYLTKIMHRFQKTLETEEDWQEEWASLEEDLLDVQKRGLKDLETVRRDREYELFYIRREDGRPFFSRNLLRHIKLVGDFDETLSDPTGEDPLLRIKVIQDRLAHDLARTILEESSAYLDLFCKEAMRYRARELVAALNKALMALMLSADPRNLLSNTVGKSALAYFHDFHYYLRFALSTKEYRQILSTAFDELDPFSHVLVNLSYLFCTLFFTSSVERKEAVELVRRLIKRHEEGKRVHAQQGVLFWEQFLDQDDQIRFLLKHYPNGPLLKTLDVLREGEEHEGFDPLFQENLPAEVFAFSYDALDVSCLRLPCPTKQEVVNKAEVVEEFASFVRSTHTKVSGKKHLLLNLQDRTSWREHARSIALEQMHRKAEFTENLAVVTLPKSTDFYLQADVYQELSEAALFIGQLKEQIASGEQCGFYFPQGLRNREFSDFVERVALFVHHFFFSKKKELERKERLDFIEIFYQLLTLKCVDLIKPDSMSLTCKDALDTGASATAALYAFLKLMRGGSAWTAEEREQLLFLLYVPALFIRERAIDAQRLHRTVSMLATVQAQVERDADALVQAADALFSTPLFSQLALRLS